MEDLAAHFNNRIEPSTYPHANPTPPLYYSLLSLLPGLFEYSLGKSAANDPWRQKLARRWETLFESGYSKDLWLVQNRANVTRYIPIERTIERNYTTFPSDSISEVLKGTTSIGVAFCQCKQARKYSGFNDCISSTMETCMTTGVIAEHLIGKGLMRRVDFSEALDIKVKANESGLVTWGLNIGVNQSNFFCSCCKCCCYILRNITEYNLPGLHVEPNYYPAQKENTTCVKCGRCVSACPVNARKFVTDSDGNRLYVEVDSKRCIGCGVCNVKCPQSIFTMKRFDDAKPAPEDFSDLAVEFGTYFATQQIKKLIGL